MPICTYCKLNHGTFYITRLRAWACGPCYQLRHITSKVRELISA